MFARILHYTRTTHTHNSSNAALIFDNRISKRIATHLTRCPRHSKSVTLGARPSTYSDAEQKFNDLIDEHDASESNQIA